MCLVVGVAGVANAQGKSATAKNKVTVCHARGNGTYAPLTVSASALPGHLSHGDVLQPNGTVPGSPGFVFDNSCQVVSWSYASNASPDPSAFDPASPGNLYAGSGIPAVNFGTARNESAGIELGMMILYRQGPTVASSDDYADGVLEYDVASGAQSTANGSFANNAARAAWNFTYSVATGLNGATTDLNDFTFQLLIDVDPGPGTNFQTLALEAELTPQAAGQSGFQWRLVPMGPVPIADDEGTTNVTQNSQNYAFYGIPGYNGGTGFAGPATFDVVLQAFDGAQLIARNHIVVNVNP